MRVDSLWWARDRHRANRSTEDCGGLVALGENDLRARVQKIMGDLPVTVVGSGLSCAEGLPGMEALATHLVENVVPERSEIGEWSQVCDRLAAKEGLEDVLQSTSVSDPLRRKVVRSTHALILGREREAVKRTIRGEPLPLARLLAKHLATTGRRATVVTTNYDRLVELAAEQAQGVVYTGFTVGGHRRRDNESRWQLYRQGASRYTPERTVDVWKVHGSVDWFHTAEGVRSTSYVAEMMEDHHPVMVAPGQGKYVETHQEPYRSIAQEADKAMRGAKSFFCLGYGFNDDHVQPNLLLRARHQLDPAPVVLLARDLTPAAAKLLIDEKCPKYAAFTAHDGGTVVFANDAPDGTFFPDVSYWRLGEFLNWIWGNT